MHSENRYHVLGMGHVSLSDDESVQHEPDHEPEAMHEEEVPEYDCPHYHFALQRVELPRDGPAQGAFDNRSDFVLGDPGAHFEGEHTCDYPVSGAKGMCHWSPLFRYLLLHFEHVRWLSTVFVLVDNRGLTESSTPHESLSHWPSVEAWWKSRLTMYGPAEELCDFLYIPISQEAGLQNGDPVLAALSFLFPGVHVVLLDSDCVPVTLFVVADLWKEVSLLRTRHYDHAAASCRNLYETSQFSTESAPKAPKLGRQELQQTEIGQGILLVTEHNAEINAGFIVVFSSNSKHAAPIDEARWRSIYAGTQAPEVESTLQGEADRLEQLYWAKVKDLLDTRKSVSAMSDTECAAWTQSGLALTPFAGCTTQVFL